MSHVCLLNLKDTSGLPRLAPNACRLRRTLRYMRHVVLVTHSHYKCRKMYRNFSAIRAERRRHATGPYFYVIHPMSSLSVVMEVAFVFVYMFLLCYEPLRSFMIQDEPELAVQFKRYAVHSVQTVLTVLWFNIGYVEAQTKQIVLETKKIVRKYLTTYFVWDFAANMYMGFIMQRMAQYVVDEEFRYYFRDFYLYVRVLALWIRLSTLLQSLEDLLLHLNVGKSIRSIVVYTVRTLMYLHICAYFIFGIPKTIYMDNFPPDSWVSQAQLNRKSPVIYQYCETFIMAACYFTGIAYIHEGRLLNEQIILVVISFVGRLYTLYLLADVLNLFGVTGVSESLYERNLAMLMDYMDTKELPANLKRRMLSFYRYKFQRRYFKENDIIDSLSEGLRTELFLFSAGKLCEKVQMFSKLPKETLGAIVASMHVNIYSANEVIIGMGSEVQDIYYISSGTVTITDARGFELCHLEDGNQFGITSLLLSVQIYSVMAVETTEVFTINKDVLKQFLLPHPDAINDLYKAAKRRLRQLQLLSQRADEPNLLTDLQSGLVLEVPSVKLREH
ncbi:hypothetical protein NQ315_000339 [Exocentrus adspersus]|uniref:Cyclic nucleotide-binding domain-containing protein n=1 Tax=Exocentrus adspersus TaxID=1586481 RepID=A0AAV8VRR9_9CUCU|nr:hypothetical protein NQ315_000339 [Exocentrus adspersus]